MKRYLACAALGVGCVLVIEGSVRAQNLSTYGTPGLIDMPTAEVMPDGGLAITGAAMKNIARGTVAFQMLPWAYGSFRYAYHENTGSGLSNYDRSFDIHFRLWQETETRPAVGIGLRDFGGTGRYASEYVVLTKTFAEQWKVTGGMGWGRLAERNSFTNPLAIFGDKFKTRPPNDVGVGGKPAYDTWFKGDAALFGGVEYVVNDNLSLLAEYSSDTYSREAMENGFDASFPINVGLNYRFKNGVNLNAYYMYGSTLGLQIHYILDPRKPATSPGGQGKAAPALKPANQVALASWNVDELESRDLAARDVLRARLDAEGLRMVGYGVEGNRATVEIENNRFNASAQAVGRAARIMANTLDPKITEFHITLLRKGLPISTVETRRGDLYELENDVDGAWRTLARTVIRDEPLGLPHGTVDGAFPHTGYRFGPYMRLSFFDPDNPLRYEIGLELKGDYVATPGLFFSGSIRQPLVSTLKDTQRVSNSVLPHVRTDWAEYAKQSDLQLNRLTANYMWRPGTDLFARVTGGYLEEMFGGLSAEVLWYPNASQLAVGGEINYAKQRDFDMLFGFQDYDTVTGHASVYYNMGGDYHLQVDAGRYLAKDWGATFTLDREFNNGFKVGAFATFTNVSAEEFGEGSFDKGIRFEVPVAWLTGRPTRSKIKQTIRPTLRDGGARLHVDNRLYEYTREERAGRIVGQWGRFYK